MAPRLCTFIVVANDATVTFSTALDIGYLVCRSMKKDRKYSLQNIFCCQKVKKTHQQFENVIQICWQGRILTSFLVEGDTEVDEATKKEQEKKAAGNPSCNASNGRTT